MAENTAGKVGHVYAYGDICGAQGDNLSEWGIVSLSTIKAGIEANIASDEIVVHIHSFGGSVIEGFAIYDYLMNCGKKITTVIEGMCASMATVIFLAGSDRKITANSRFMIHNPWAEVGGNADELRAYADQLQIEQTRMSDLYIQKTGIDPEVLATYMVGETEMSADLALSLGFCTEIIGLQAAAKLRNPLHQARAISTEQTQKTEQVDKTKNTKIKAFMASISAAVAEILGTSTDPVEAQAASSKLADGTELFFAEGEELAEGIAVFSDAELTTPAPDNDYELENGTIVTVLDGLVSALKAAEPAPAEPAPAADPNAELLAQANARIAELEAEAIEMQASIEQSATALAKVKSDWTPNARTPEFKKPAGKAEEKEGTAAEFKAKVEARRAEMKKK